MLDKVYRAILEGVAVSMVTPSMEYMGDTVEAEAWEQVKGLSDTELLYYVYEV